MRDFTKKQPVRPPLNPAGETKAMERYIRDLNLDGKTMLPGKSETEEMVGVDPDHLKLQMEKNEELKGRLLRDMAATWKCTQCGLEQEGKYIRVQVVGGIWQKINGVRTLVGGQEVLICRTQSCNGPVVKVNDPYRSKWI